jgi:hypothetical protein
LDPGPRPRIAHQPTLTGRRSAEELHPRGLGGGGAQRSDPEALGALDLDQRAELLARLRAQRSDFDKEGIDHAASIAAGAGAALRPAVQTGG